MRTAEESYEMLRSVIENIPDEEVVTATMPVSDVIGEAEELQKNAMEDRDTLIKSGLDVTLIDSLPDRIGAYAVAESELNAIAFAKSEARKEWLKIEPEAIDLKRTLLHTLRFVFKRNGMKSELKSIGEIAAGKGRRDLVIDMMDLHKLAGKHVELLATVGIERSIVDDANAMFEKLRRLLGDINSLPKEVADKKRFAQKAYTYLWESVDNIREFGQFAFWKDEDKVDLYRSSHYRELGKRSHDNDNRDERLKSGIDEIG